MKARTISVTGDFHPHCEDFFSARFDPQIKRVRIAVGDFAHNVDGDLYADPETALALRLPPDTRFNGGVIGSTVCRRVIELTSSTGLELVYELNEAIQQKYVQLGITDYEQRGESRFTGLFAHVDLTPERALITAVGDVRCACDGTVVAGFTKEIDEVHARLRQERIAAGEDPQGVYDKWIKPALLRQYREYQNKPASRYAYPAIDGTETMPVEQIAVCTLPVPKRILLWSDGYLPPSEDFSIEGLERQIAHVYEVDPMRCRDYPAIGIPKDDRTAVELTIDDDWAGLIIAHA